MGQKWTVFGAALAAGAGLKVGFLATKESYSLWVEKIVPSLGRLFCRLLSIDRPLSNILLGCAAYLSFEASSKGALVVKA